MDVVKHKARSMTMSKTFPVGSNQTQNLSASFLLNSRKVVIVGLSAYAKITSSTDVFYAPVQLSIIPDSDNSAGELVGSDTEFVPVITGGGTVYNRRYWYLKGDSWIGYPFGNRSMKRFYVTGTIFGSDLNQTKLDPLNNVLEIIVSFDFKLL